MRVVVTGAAGYIGGQTLLHLLDQGHEVLALDTRAMPEHLINQFAHGFNDCCVTDFASDQALSVIQQFGAEAVIHCAGTSLVGPSINNPKIYYENNFVRTKRLVDFLVQHGIRLVFSSSAAVYGEPVITPCSEVDPVLPISPYGESKAMIEWMLASYARAYGLSYVAFRYFNACGADPQVRHGQEPGATHIIARVLESIRNQSQFTLYGNQYPTPDGTCVRDYVHVADIARAHVLALTESVPTGVYNLGSNTGTSNHEIILAAQRITGREVQITVGAQRAGDPAMLTASADRFTDLVHWRHYSLDHMIQHAWNWYCR